MKILTKVKEIKSRSGEMHFERWAIIETPWFSWYLHKFNREDQDHLHSHPWNFISMNLKGQYMEQVDEKGNGQYRYKLKKPFRVSYTNHVWFHKILKIVKGPVWTTVFVFGGNFYGDKWHYAVAGKAVPFEEYFKLKKEAREKGISIEEILGCTKPK